ncbi:MAG TPA: hypothetical protein VFI09_00925 [Solirubrobacterales bacterium]|nr:hypothetical protein [Solirubrobacterales bacterium]
MKRTPDQKIGTYGCGTAGRVVRVGLVAGAEQAPQFIAVERCPACHHVHPRVAVLWRWPTAFDAVRPAEVLVDQGGRQA